MHYLKRFSSLFLFSCLLASTAFTNNVDSLLNELSGLKNNAKRLDILEELCDILPTDSTELAIQLCDEGIEISKIEKDFRRKAHFHFTKGFFFEILTKWEETEIQYDSVLSIGLNQQSFNVIAKGYYALGNMQIKRGNIDKAKSYLDSAITYLTEDEEIQEVKAFVYHRMGDIQHIKGDYIKAIELYKLIVDSFKLESEKIRALVYRGLAKSNNRLSNYNQAIQYQLKAIEICRDIGLGRLEASILNDVGTTYLNLKEWDKAIEYFETSIELCKKGNILSLMASVYHNLGSANIRKENFSLAMDYLNKSLELNNQIGTDRELIPIAINMAYVAELRGEVAFAKNQYLKALKMAQEKGHKGFELGALVYLSTFNLGIEDYSESLKYSKLSLELATQIKDKDNMSNSYLNLSESYAGLKEHDKAYEYLVLAKSYNDSLREEKKRIEIARLENNFNMENKQKEFDLQQKELSFVKRQKELTDYKNNMLIGSLILLFFLSILLIINYRKRNQLKVKQLALENDLLANKRELIEERLKKEEFSKKDYKNKLEELTKRMILKNEEYGKMEKDLERMKDEKYLQLTKETKSAAEAVLQISQSKEDWDTFMEYFQENYHGYIEKLKTAYKSLTPYDLRLCALLRINLTTKEIAAILNITPASLRTSKYRLRKKLNLEEENNLIDFLLEF